MYSYISNLKTHLILFNFWIYNVCLQRLFDLAMNDCGNRFHDYKCLKYDCNEDAYIFFPF